MSVKRYFAVQFRAFGAIGIDFTQKGDIFARPWLTWLPALALTYFVVTMSHYSFAHITELDLMTDAMTPFLQCFLSLWKLYIFVRERKNMVKLVERLWAQIAQASEEELSLIAKVNARITIHNAFYFISVASTGSLALIVPLVIGLISYFREGKWNYVTPVKATYLVEYANPLNYSIIFCITCLTVYGLVNSSVAIDSLFSWFVHNIVAQLKILKLQMAQINTDLVEGATLQELEFSLIQCFQYHQMIITLAEQLNVVYRPIVFVEFTLDAVQICVIAYQLGKGIALARLPFLCGFLVAVSVQLMIYSYGGERLKNESESIAMTMYNTLPWQELPIRLRRLILIAIMRAQKPCKVSGIFFEVGFSQLLLVYRTAASYVTLLRSVDQKEGVKLAP